MDYPVRLARDEETRHAGVAHFRVLKRSKTKRDVRRFATVVNVVRKVKPHDFNYTAKARARFVEYCSTITEKRFNQFCRIVTSKSSAIIPPC